LSGASSSEGGRGKCGRLPSRHPAPRGERVAVDLAVIVPARGARGKCGRLPSRHPAPRGVGVSLDLAGIALGQGAARP